MTQGSQLEHALRHGLQLTTAGHFSWLRVGFHYENGAAVCFGLGGATCHLRGKHPRTARGSAYFLAAARVPNSHHAQEFFASSNEIQVARNGGQDVVELALLAKK